MITWLTAGLRPYLLGAIALCGIGIASTIYIQNARINHLKSEVADLQGDVARAVTANKTNNETIQQLKAERDKAGASCRKRLADADATIAALHKIDETKGGRHDNRQVGNSSMGGGAGTDDLLDALNGMLPGQGGSSDGICKAAGAPVSGGAGMVSGDVLYCLDEVNAKNLLKDFLLCRAWALDGMQAIEGMK